MHAFEQQNSSQTLRAGIDEYFLKNPGLSRGDQLSPEAQAFFRSHDTAHVIFGCGTTLPHEAIVKLSSMFGTTAGFSVLRGYRLHESIDIYRQLGVRRVLSDFSASLFTVPATINRCLRQHKRWPWSDFTDLMDVPLDELRSEYGIRVPGHRS